MRYLVLLLSFITSVAYAAIEIPEAPPELGDTLTDFRTKEQQAQSKFLEFGDERSTEVFLEDPVIPGDAESGLLRLSYVYVGSEQVTVPQNGRLILRFYDANGNPWDIVNVTMENQGFSASVSAAPSELVVTQLQGASSSSMSVKLVNLGQPLVFNLKPLSLINNKKAIKVVLNTIKVNYVNQNARTVPAHEFAIATPNPNAQRIEFTDIDFDVVHNTLIEALNDLKVN